MHPRIDIRRINQDAYKAMRGLQSFVDAAGLEKSLRELVNIRASQINGCAFCLHMHFRDARKAGETQERLDLIGAWREAPVFTARERAALAWTEAVTLVADTHVPDDVYDTARTEFSEQELVDLTMAVVTINCLEPIDGCLPDSAGCCVNRVISAPLGDGSPRLPPIASIIGMWCGRRRHDPAPISGRSPQY
jgi:AhpD family alkylhydroperoxidase